MLAEEQPRCVKFYQALASMTQKGLLLFKTDRVSKELRRASPVSTYLYCTVTKPILGEAFYLQ